jgi:GcrA cell cycle regulator
MSFGDPWTDAAILDLRALWTDGHGTAEIGRRMDITKNAVIGKAHRLDLEPRESPIKRLGPGFRAKVQELLRDGASQADVARELKMNASTISDIARAPLQPIKLPVGARTPPTLPAIIVALPVRVAPPVRAIVVPLPIARRDPTRLCTWVDRGPDRKWITCGEPSWKHPSWCKKHHKVVYLPRRTAA